MRSVPGRLRISAPAQVAEKYFHCRAPVTHDITLSMGQILASRMLIVMANGAKKRDVMHRAMYGAVTDTLPASAVQEHPNCIVSLDEAAES